MNFQKTEDKADRYYFTDDLQNDTNPNYRFASFVEDYGNDRYSLAQNHFDK